MTGGKKGVVACAVALLTAGCASATTAPQTTLKPQGPEARYIDRMFFPVFWIAVGVFAIVAGIALTAIIRFRARPGDELPRQVHGNTKLEIVWTVIPLMLVGGVAVASVIGIFHLYDNPGGARISFVPGAASDTGRPALQGRVLEVHVIGHRWWWEFDYPGLGTMPDQFLSTGERPNTALVTADELHIPAGYMVRLDLTSNEPARSPEGIGPGVIHAFWVPELAGAH